MNVTETFRGFSAQRSLPRGGERTGCTPLHCHVAASARAARPHTATRRRAYRNGTLRAEWKCHPHGTARSGPSGSAAHTATRRRTHGLHALTLPLDVERTKTVRSGPSGSAIHMELHAQARVAVPPTLPLDGERTGSTPSHCHSTSSVPKRYAQGRMAGPLRRPSGATAGQGVCRPPGCRERGESDERREAPERAKRAWLKCEESPAGRRREVREGPAPGRSHPGCGPGLPDGREDANAAQKSMSTLLKNKFHSLSSGHIA